MRNTNCCFCEKGEELARLGKYVCTLGVSDLYLCREQSYPGRCMVVFRGHVADLTQLKDGERDSFFYDVPRVGKAVQSAFQPDKLNYGIVDDEGGHLHLHLVPKYQDGMDWGGTFALNPGKRYLQEDEYTVLAEMIKAGL